jgi:P4 family phage/plasmid primase-like protien
MSEAPFAVTLFADFAATTNRRTALTLRELADRIAGAWAPTKDQLPWLKLATFGDVRSAKGSLRHDANMLAITGVEADYDGEKIPFDDAVGILEKAGLEALLYTSPSHQRDGHGPRWRILCPASREYPPAVREHYLNRLAGLFRDGDATVLAAESWTASQAYYFGAVDHNPAHRVEIIDGQPLDELDELDLIALGKPGKPERKDTGPHRPGPPQASIGDIRAALAAIPNDWMSWERWNTLGMAVFAASGGSGRGYALFSRWSRRNRTCDKSGRERRAYDKAAVKERWRHWQRTSPPARIGFGSLMHWARRADPGFALPPPAQAETPSAREEPPPRIEPVPPIPEPTTGPNPEPDDDDFGPLPAEFSQEAMALQFSAIYSQSWRYVVLWSKWLQWSAIRWQPEDTLLAFDRMRAICRSNSARVFDDDKLAREVARASTVAGVERLTRADRRHAMTFDQWNVNRWVINQPNPGTLDLKIGKAYPHRREDYITKIAAIGADPDCPIPLWTAFLDRVTAGDKELQAYLRRMAGYCMTGVTSEHILFFLYGSGANGKSVFLTSLLGVWNDYAAVASMETFIQTHYEQHSTDLAMLDGARLVVAQEVEKGKAWAEAKINRLTGGDPITARFMRQDFFTYTPQFKIIIAANHKPSLRSVNEVTRRRFHLVPFTVTIPPEQRDKQLAEKLKPEWPGIFNWALEGCLEWQKIGLASPEVVRKASEEYFAEEDTIARWIEECCTTGREQWGIGTRLWDSWAKWAEAGHEFAGSRKRFAQELIDRGYPAEKSQHIRGHRGLDLRPPPDPRD